MTELYLILILNFLSCEIDMLHMEIQSELQEGSYLLLTCQGCLSLKA